MGNLSLKVAKIVGTPTFKNWSWVYNFFPEEEEKKRKRGVLLAVLSLRRLNVEEENETATIGREILLRLHEEYYGEKEASILEKLTQTVEKVGREFSSEEQVLEMTVAVLIENVLYLAVFGSGEVWLKREDKLSRILQGKSEGIESASGFLKEEDLLFLGTPSLFRILGEGVLRAALESGEPQEIVESVSPLIHTHELADQAAALVGKTEREEEEEGIKDEELAPAKNLGMVPQKSLEIVGRFVSKIWGKIPRLSIGTIYIRTQEGPRKRRALLLIAIILIFLLSASLFFGAQKRKENEEKQRFLKSYEEVVQLLEQGKGLATLNPNQSREALKQAQFKLEDLKNLKIESEKTAQLEQEVETALFSVFKEYELTSVPVFLDLTLISESGRGDDLSFSRHFLAILDRENNRVLGTEIQRKSAAILAGGGAINKSRLVAAYPDLVFVLEEEGLAQIGVRNKKIEKGKIKTDSDWGEIQALWVYGGNVYLLDKGKNQIWRYPVTEEGFGARQKWLAQDAPFLGQAVSMAIDGSIWILSQEGKIYKFTQGTPAPFGVVGLTKAFTSPTVIYTDEEANSLYVLDKGNRRIVVLAKSGQYQAEYRWEGLEEVSDMVVSETEKKILLLAGSKIYEIGLKP